MPPDMAIYEATRMLLYVAFGLTSGLSVFSGIAFFRFFKQTRVRWSYHWDQDDRVTPANRTPATDR